MIRFKIVGARYPSDEPESNDIWLIVKNAVTPHNQFFIPKLISTRLTVAKTPINRSQRFAAAVEEGKGLDEVVVAAHLNVLYSVVMRESYAPVERVE